MFIRGKSGQSIPKFTKDIKENMEDNRNSDRSEEELRGIIRKEIHQSRAKRGENLYARTQAMIRGHPQL